LTVSVSDEGYSNLLTVRVSDEDYSNLLNEHIR
jgi:predicted CopG family antitoxin